MKRISAINAIFWGLLIIFINIKIGDFDIFNDFLGLLILMGGLYSLRIFNKLFLGGFYIAQIKFAWQIFCSVLSFSTFTDQMEVSVSFMVISFFINILMFYFILTGLSKLAMEQNLNHLSSRLTNGFNIYAMLMILATVFFFLMPFALVILILVLIFHIYLLVLIRSAYNSINDTPTEEANKSSKISLIFSMILTVALPIALGIGVIAMSEIHTVETQPFIKHDLPENQDLIISIRSKMIDLGFNPDVVDSMPDSEILLHKNIKSVQTSQSREFACHDGKLVITQYISDFDLQNFRYTVYYTWTQKPKVAHAEALGIILHNRGISYINQSAFSSLNLFDVKDVNGNNQTYTSRDITDYQKSLHYVKKFKLVNKKKANNYRGYIAANVQMSLNDSWSFNNSLYYIHQRTVFNNRGKDIIDFNKDKEWFSVEHKDMFFEEYNIMGYVERNK